MDAITRQFVLPIQPQVRPHLPVVYPWESTNLYNLCQQLYELARNTGYTDTFEVFKTHFGAYLQNDDIVIDFDAYQGQYTVTPLPNVEQILRTEHKLLAKDVVVEPIPYSEVSNAFGGTTVIIG